MLSRLGATLAAIALLPSAVDAQTRPPEVYVIEGACPFECCMYGRWLAERSVALRAEPRSTAPLVGRVEGGDSITAITGQVRSIPTPFVFRTDYYGGFAAGDTVWVLDYLGEGYFGVWKGGGRIEVSLDFSPYGGTSGTRCEECSHGSLLEEHRFEWWVLVRTAAGAEGWTSDTEAFSGSDACGCE